MRRALLIWVSVCAVLVAASIWFVRVESPGRGAEPGWPDGDAHADRERFGLSSAGDALSAAQAQARASALPEGQSAAQPMADPLPVFMEGSPEPFAGAPDFWWASGIVDVLVLRDEDGAPLAGADVRLEHQPKERVATTDTVGRAVLTGAPAGSLDVRATAVGRAAARGTVVVSRSSPHATLELRLGSSREVVVRLVGPDGRAFDPADWALARSDLTSLGLVLAATCPPSGGAVTTAGALAYQASRLPEESGHTRWLLSLAGGGPVCAQVVLGDVVLGAAEVPAGATAVDVRIDAAAVDRARSPIAVRVVEAAGGGPVASATLELPALLGPRATLSADVHGRIRVARPFTGTIEVTVRAAGFGSQRLRLSRPAEAESVVRLEPALRITGRVVDATGMAVQGARITLRDGASTERSVVRPTFLSRHGEFDFADLAAGAYLVEAQAADPKTRVLRRAEVAVGGLAGGTRAIEVRLSDP